MFFNSWILFLLHFRTLSEYQVLRGHSGPVYSCSMVPDSDVLLSCSEDTTSEFILDLYGTSIHKYRLRSKSGASICWSKTYQNCQGLAVRCHSLTWKADSVLSYFENTGNLQHFRENSKWKKKVCVKVFYTGWLTRLTFFKNFSKFLYFKMSLVSVYSVTCIPVHLSTYKL